MNSATKGDSSTGIKRFRKSGDFGKLHHYSIIGLFYGMEGCFVLVIIRKLIHHKL